MLEAAVAAGAPIEAIYVAPDVESSGEPRVVCLRARGEAASGSSNLTGVMERVADAVTPSRCSVCRHGRRRVGEASLETRRSSSVIDVRDPGNVGAIIRSADAAGAAAVVCLCRVGGSLQPEGRPCPRRVRSSISRSSSREPLLKRLPRSVPRASAGSLRCATAVRTTPRPISPVGSRSCSATRRPASAPISIRAVDGALTIPIAGGAESLNVAMAATVLCFECRAGAEEPALAPLA